jgi:protein SFI1
MRTTDVAILHDIVLHAEELLASLPERERIPTNALFHAYYAILPSIGIDADHDNRYARIIFKIGGRRGEGSLYEKFEDVLSQMGIEIQFDHAEEEEDHNISGHPVDTTLDVLPKFNPRTDETIDRVARKRRNSETPTWPIGVRNDAIGQRPRSNSLQSRSYVEHLSESSQGHGSAASLFETAGISTSETRFRRKESTEAIGAWLNTKLGDYDGSPVAKSTIPDCRPIGQEIEQKIPSSSSVLSQTVGVKPAFNDRNSDFSQQRQREMYMHLHRPIDSDDPNQEIIEIKIAIFANRYNQSSLRRVLRHWRQRTTELLEEDGNLNALAKNRDRLVLLRQGFDTWLANLREWRQVLETERFFFHLECRAKRARDLFLLSKAFTHWATSASDEIQRTSVARRHILRTRFFKAWREITAVNELKVRRHVLRKFFISWRRRQIDTVDRKEDSVTLFHESLVKRIFWSWFWAFCDRRAPIWWADRSKRRYLAAWTVKSQNFREICTGAVSNRQQHTKSLACSIWAQHLQEVREQYNKSTVLHKKTLCARALSSWRRYHILLPSSRQVYENVEWGLITKTFKIWLLRTRQERQAGELDRNKVKREAWIAWNDKVRCRALQLHISDRNMVQSLYKWVLAERLNLACRLADQKLLRGSLLHTIYASKSSFRQTISNVDIARRFHEYNVTHSIFQRWRSHLKRQRELEQCASMFSSSPIQAETLFKWSRYMQNARQLHIWATDANFYFIGRKVLKKWQNSTEISKREKRRVTYAYIRRQNKLNLASVMLSKWRQQAGSVTDNKRHASQIHSNQTIVYGMNAFDHWRARTEEVVELNLLCPSKRLRTAYHQWRACLEEHYHLEVVALKSNEDRLLLICLKKWSRLVLQFRAHQHLVSELRDKYTKRSIRKMMLHWRQSSASLQKREVAVTAERRAARSGKVIEIETSKRTEAWSEFGDEIDPVDWAQGNGIAFTKSAIPGYLTTPSKRTSMARSMANLSSTTPIAPLSTPYERQLRAQLSGRPLSSYSRMTSTKLFSKSRGFEDLVEQSPDDTG